SHTTTTCLGRGKSVYCLAGAGEPKVGGTRESESQPASGKVCNASTTQGSVRKNNTAFIWLLITVNQICQAIRAIVMSSLDCGKTGNCMVALSPGALSASITCVPC